MNEFSKEASSRIQSRFKVSFEKRGRSERPQEYFQRNLLKNIITAIEKNNIKVDHQTFQDLYEVAGKFGEITGNNEAARLTDPLTGLYNRDGFKRSAEAEMAKAKRLKEKNIEYPLTLAFIDLDNFKTLNDEFTHEAGDDFLINMADLMNANKRAEDICARWVGDEFLFFFVGSSHQNAKAVMGRIEETSNDFIKIAFNQTSKPLGFTYGLKEWDGKQDLKSFLKTADQELLDLKKEKKEKS